MVVLRATVSGAEQVAPFTPFMPQISAQCSVLTDHHGHSLASHSSPSSHVHLAYTHASFITHSFLSTPPYSARVFFAHSFFTCIQSRACLILTDNVLLPHDSIITNTLLPHTSFLITHTPSHTFHHTHSIFCSPPDSGIRFPHTLSSQVSSLMHTSSS